MKNNISRKIKKLATIFLALSMLFTSIFMSANATGEVEQELEKLVLDFSDSAKAEEAMAKLTAYHNLGGKSEKYNKITDRWAYDANKKALMYKNAVAGQGAYGLLDALKLSEEYTYKNFDVTVTYYATANALTVNGGVWVGGRVKSDTCLYHSGNDTTYSDTQASIYSLNVSGSRYARYGYSTKYNSSKVSVTTTATQVGSNTLRVRMIGDNCTVWHNGTQAYSVDAGITTEGGLSFAVSGGTGPGVDNSYGFQKIEITPIADDITQVDKDGNVKYVLDFSNENSAMLAMDSLSTYAIYNSGTVENQKMSDRWAYDADKKALMYKKGAAGQSVFSLLDVLELDKAKYNFENFDLTITYYSTAEALNANGGVWVGARVAADNRLYHKNSDTTYSDKQATIFSARISGSNRVRYGYNNQQLKNEAAVSATEGANTLRVRMIGNNCTVWHNGTQAYSVDAGITSAGGLSFAVSSNIVGNNYGFQKIEITPIADSLEVTGQDGIKRIELDFSNESSVALAMQSLTSYYNESTKPAALRNNTVWVYDNESGALKTNVNYTGISMYNLIDVLKLNDYNFKNFNLKIEFNATDADLEKNGGIWVGLRDTAEAPLYKTNGDNTYTSTQTSIFLYRHSGTSFVKMGYAEASKRIESIPADKGIQKGSNIFEIRMLGNECLVTLNGTAVLKAPVRDIVVGGLSFGVSGANYGFKNVEITCLDEQGNQVSYDANNIGSDEKQTVSVTARKELLNNGYAAITISSEDEVFGEIAGSVNIDTDFTLKTIKNGERFSKMMGALTYYTEKENGYDIDFANIGVNGEYATFILQGNDINLSNYNFVGLDNDVYKLDVTTINYSDINDDKDVDICDLVAMSGYDSGNTEGINTDNIPDKNNIVNSISLVRNKILGFDTIIVE